MSFNLTAIGKGVTHAPPRLVIYGQHGLGKSTFASEAPAAVMLFTEDGKGLLDVASWPSVAKSWSDVESAITGLATGEHAYQTFALDTLDWLEPLVQAETARRNGWATIEQPGFGKGYLAADDVWREFLSMLDRLRTERGMQVILLAHCEVKRFDDPTTEPYDRFQIKLQKRAADLVKEWSDATLFLSQKTYVEKSKVGLDKAIARGVGLGQRILYTEERPAFSAKNRYGLPPEISMPKGGSYAALAAQMFKPTA